MMSSPSEIEVAVPPVKTKGAVFARPTLNVPVGQGDAMSSHSSILLSDHLRRATSRSETKRETPPPNVIWSRRRRRCFESDLGDDPHTVNFPFAFSVALIVVAGCTLAVTGVIVTSAALFFLGVLVVMPGLWLYGWSLCDEEL
jgi:hypothetical protein